MQFFKKISNNSIKCLACRHYCTIPLGSFGFCGTRKNEGNNLILLTHSRPASLHLDPIEKKPLYHYFPGSKTLSMGFFGCNFKCDFCQNFDITFKRRVAVEKEASLIDEVSPKKFVQIAIEQKANSISFTYNEPSINIEYNVEAIIEAKKQTPSLGVIYVSNGFESAEQIKLLTSKKTKLDAINIDLKSFNENFYKKICGADLEGVIDSIKKFHSAVVLVELTTLLIPEKNDSIDEIKQIAKFISSVDKNIPWHVSAFYPMHRFSHLPPTSIESIRTAIKIGFDEGLNFVYGGNIFNSEFENTYCPSCGNTLIKREGFGVEITGMNKNSCSRCGEKIIGVFQ